MKFFVNVKQQLVEIYERLKSNSRLFKTNLRTTRSKSEKVFNTEEKSHECEDNFSDKMQCDSCSSYTEQKIAWKTKIILFSILTSISRKKLMTFVSVTFVIFVIKN